MPRRVVPVAQKGWVDESLADPAFREEFLREVRRMHLEAIDQKNPMLARWCMLQRARLDSTDSKR